MVKSLKLHAAVALIRSRIDPSFWKLGGEELIFGMKNVLKKYTVPTKLLTNFFVEVDKNVDKNGGRVTRVFLHSNFIFTFDSWKHDELNFDGFHIRVASKLLVKVYSVTLVPKYLKVKL